VGLFDVEAALEPVSKPSIYSGRQSRLTRAASFHTDSLRIVAG